jgi:AraC-like DNA-binding protein
VLEQKLNGIFTSKLRSDAVGYELCRRRAAKVLLSFGNRSSEMVVEYTRYKIENSRKSAFVDTHRRAIRYLDSRSIRYELTQCSDQPEWYTFRTEWESSEQLGRFLDDAAGKAFLHALSGFEHDIQEQRFWELTDVVHSTMALLSRIAEDLRILTVRPPWDRLYPWIIERSRQKTLVGEMAERVNMRPRNFARVFRREFCIPAGEFLVRVRVAAAKSDLEEGMSIKQIAVRRGFGSSSTMRRTFLRVLGVAPSEYRARIPSTPMEMRTVPQP